MSSAWGGILRILQVWFESLDGKYNSSGDQELNSVERWKIYGNYFVGCPFGNGFPIIVTRYIIIRSEIQGEATTGISSCPSNLKVTLAWLIVFLAYPSTLVLGERLHTCCRPGEKSRERRASFPCFVPVSKGFCFRKSRTRRPPVRVLLRVLSDLKSFGSVRFSSSESKDAFRVQTTSPERLCDTTLLEHSSNHVNHPLDVHLCRRCILAQAKPAPRRVSVARSAQRKSHWASKTDPFSTYLPWKWKENALCGERNNQVFPVFFPRSELSTSMSLCQGRVSMVFLPENT